MYTTYQPQDWFGDIQDARLIARGEEVNGVVTDHYRFDQNNVNLGTVSAAEGDIWISQDGGYTVKLTARATGSGFFLADMDNGEMTWEYSLSEINQDRQISLPEKCAAQAPSTDIPTPPDANEVSMFAGMTTFTTTDTVEGVSNFYRAELPNQGWDDQHERHQRRPDPECHDHLGWKHNVGTDHRNREIKRLLRPPAIDSELQ
jgi:hypothetical protein